MAGKGSTFVTVGGVTAGSSVHDIGGGESDTNATPCELVEGGADGDANVSKGGGEVVSFGSSFGIVDDESSASGNVI